MHLVRVTIRDDFRHCDHMQSRLHALPQSEALDPVGQGGVVDLQAALQEQLLGATIAQGITQVPGDGLQDQQGLEVPALEVVLRPTLQFRSDRVQDLNRHTVTLL